MSTSKDFWFWLIANWYFLSPSTISANYFELDIDIASSAIAQKVVGVAYGYAKLLTVDMAFVLEVGVVVVEVVVLVVVIVVVIVVVVVVVVS